MKVFKFNLDIVRRLRGVDEDRKKREFGDALRGSHGRGNFTDPPLKTPFWNMTGRFRSAATKL